MINNREKVIAELQTDIFEHTGLKVGQNDPLIASAILQSRLMQDAAKSIGAELKQLLQTGTSEHVQTLNTKINEYLFHIDERISQLNNTTEKLLGTKKQMVEDMTQKSHQLAIESVKNEMRPLLDQYSRSKIYVTAACIGIVAGCLPIIVILALKLL